MARGLDRPDAAEHRPRRRDDDAAPRRTCRSGTVCLPISRVIDDAVALDPAARAPGVSPEREDGVCLPFCSRTTSGASRLRARAPSTTTSSGVAAPTNFSGLVICDRRARPSGPRRSRRRRPTSATGAGTEGPDEKTHGRDDSRGTVHGAVERAPCTRLDRCRGRTGLRKIGSSCSARAGIV